MNPSLLIFTQIAIAGSVFAGYFLYALWRESRNARRRPRVEIKPVSTQVNARKVVQLYSVDKARARRVRGISGR